MNTAPRLAAAAVALAVAAPAQDLDRPAAADAFPEDALVYAGIDGVDEFLDELRATDLGELVIDVLTRNPQLQDELRVALDDFADRFRERTTVDPFELLDGVRGELGFALLELVPSDTPGMNSTPEAVAFAFVAELGDGVDAFAERWDAIWDEADELAVDYEDLDGLPVTTIEDPNGVLLTYAFVDSTFLLTSEIGAARERDHFLRVLDVLEGFEPSLAERPAFRASSAGRDGELFRIFVEVPAFIDRLRTDDGWVYSPEADLGVLMDTLGLADVGSLGVGNHFDELRGMVGETTLEWAPGGAIHDIVTVALGEGDPPFADLVPASALTYSGLHLDLYELVTAALALLVDLDAIEPGDVGEGLAQAYDALGIDPLEDLLAYVDGRIAFSFVETDERWALPGSDDLLAVGPFNIAVIVGIDDGEAVRASFDTMLRTGGLYPSLQSEDFQGQQVRSISLAGVPVSPHWTITNDAIVFSLAPEPVKDVLRRRTSPDLPSIATRPDFVDTLEEFGARQAYVSWSSARYVGASLFANYGMLEQAVAREYPGLALELDVEALVDEHFEHPSLMTLRFVDDVFVTRQSTF